MFFKKIIFESASKALSTKPPIHLQSICKPLNYGGKNMKPFIDEDFMLKTNAAKELYRKAKEMPIFDFHCHLSPQEIWENKSYRNITELWLGGDHYKWRAMRMNGISEKYITGDGSDYDKFMAWAKTVPTLFGNPLYHWTHLELKNYFGIEKLLSPETAEYIWNTCNEKLTQEDFHARSFLKRSNVKFVGTTDDPLSDLEYHQRIVNDATIDTIVAPTFRPDGILNIHGEQYVAWITELSEKSKTSIQNLQDLLDALQVRVDYFHNNGARASDHDIPSLVYIEASHADVDKIFEKRMQGHALLENEIVLYRSFILKQLGKMYASKKWVMQLHMGALRNNNTKAYRSIGKDTGFDSIGESNFAEGISNFLDALDVEDSLPRTILYNLNAKDNAVLTGMLGNFYEEGIPGKIQFGSGWWFNDHIDGMDKQMRDLANVGILAHFIGMLTDSRSFVSFPRHDYFRRILCNLVGDWVEQGLVPNDQKLLQDMISNICYYNAYSYFLDR